MGGMGRAAGTPSISVPSLQLEPLGKAGPREKMSQEISRLGEVRVGGVGDTENPPSVTFHSVDPAENGKAGRGNQGEGLAAWKRGIDAGAGQFMKLIYI